MQQAHVRPEVANAVCCLSLLYDLELTLELLNDWPWPCQSNHWWPMKVPEFGQVRYPPVANKSPRPLT